MARSDVRGKVQRRRRRGSYAQSTCHSTSELCEMAFSGVSRVGKQSSRQTDLCIPDTARFVDHRSRCSRMANRLYSRIPAKTARSVYYRDTCRTPRSAERPSVLPKQSSAWITHKGCQRTFPCPCPLPLGLLDAGCTAGAGTAWSVSAPVDGRATLSLCTTTLSFRFRFLLFGPGDPRSPASSSTTDPTASSPTRPVVSEASSSTVSIAWLLVWMTGGRRIFSS